MNDEKKKLRSRIAALAVWLLLLAVGFWLIGEVMEDATPKLSAPTPYGERCPEGDRACYELHDVRQSKTQRPTAAQLIAEHNCWTMRDGAPGNVDGIPGGAVVRVDQGDPEYTTNAVLIGAALDAALDGAKNGVEGIAFCRGDQW